MRKIVYFFMLLVSQVSYGQEIIDGSFDAIKDAHNTNLIVDWSKVIIENLTVEEWLEKRNNERPEYDAKIELEEELKPLLVQNMLPQCNELTYKVNFALVRHQDTKYTLKVTPLYLLPTRGSLCEYEFIDSNSGASLLKFSIKESGGLYVSKRALWGGTFKAQASILGIFLKGELKKARRKK